MKELAAKITGEQILALHMKAEAGFPLSNWQLGRSTKGAPRETSCFLLFSFIPVPNMDHIELKLYLSVLSCLDTFSILES